MSDQNTKSTDAIPRENDGYCRKCRSRLYPGDAECVEATGVCSSCVTWDKTPGKVYQTMFVDWQKEQREKAQRRRRQ